MKKSNRLVLWLTIKNCNMPPPLVSTWRLKYLDKNILNAKKNLNIVVGTSYCSELTKKKYVKHSVTVYLFRETFGSFGYK